MNNTPEISLLRKVLVHIHSGDNRGSGWIAPSIEDGKFYCLTSNHCVEIESLKLFLTDDSGKEVPLTYRNIIADDKNDIAIIDVDYPLGGYPLERIFIGKLNVLYKTGKLAGFPQSRNSDLAIYSVKFQGIDSPNYKIIISLDNTNTSKQLLLDQVKGVSGGGILAIEPDSKYKLFGIETEMADKYDSFNELVGITVEAFNALLDKNGWPLLACPKYYYSSASWNGGRNVLIIKNEKYNFNNNWVDTEKSTTIIRDIQLSLLEKKERPLLICGYSGIGKTRIVLEACTQNPELSNALFFNGYGNFSEFFDDKLREYYNSTTDEPIYVIVDDITLDEWNSLTQKLSIYPNIRAVAIAEMGNKQSQNSYPYMFQMMPYDEADVIKIVHNVCPSLSEEQLQAIYRLSSNDLRFALLIAKHYTNFEDKQMWIANASALEIVQRIMTQIVNTGDENYLKIIRIFSLFVDFGYQGNASDEIEFIAKYFKYNKNLLLRVIDLCIDHHLGIKKGNYFELSPRAMARLLFSKYYLHLIKDFPEFINQIPNEELRRRFIMRAQECGEETWREVQDALASCFQQKYENAAFLSTRLYGIEILRLSSGSIKEAMTYVEFIPEVGLLWMRNLIKGAGNTALEKFSGMNGRREFIWTCERLACFKENFYTCEEILYLLSQHETEKGISNNSRGIWSELFGLLSTNTEVSFQDRFNLLITRMKGHKAGQNVDLFTAAINCAMSMKGTRILPPKMVGGRMTPECWSEKNINTLGDMIEIYFWIFTQLKENFAAMPPAMQHVVFRCLKERMHDFLSPGISKIAPDLRDQYFMTLECLSQGQDQHTEIVIAINERVKCEKFLQGRDGEKAETSQRINYLLQQRKHFESTDFISRLKICLSENIYLNRETQTGKIKKLAQELLSDTDPLQILDQVLAIDNIKDYSYMVFAEILGELDSEYKLVEKINNNFSEARNQFSEHYYLGIYKRTKNLPDFISQMLEKNINLNPSGVLQITILCDFTDTGRKRIFKLLHDGIVNNYILGLGEQSWVKLLSIRDMKDILNMLVEKNENSSIFYFFELGQVWLGNSKSNELADFLFQCAEVLPKVAYQYHVREFIRLMESMPQRLTHECIILVIRSIDYSNSASNQYDQIRFIQKHANGPYAKEIAFEVCSCLEKQFEHSRFGFSFSLLIKMLSAQAILQWIQIKDSERAEIIAYHLPAPSLEEQSIPEVTLMVLEKYGDDEQVLQRFFSGIHAWEMYNLEEIANASTKILEMLGTYKDYPLIAIRKWAEYEKSWINSRLEQKHEYDAMSGRFREE